MPSLRQLQYLIALSETGHYRLAAEKVNVSQPTLSAQLMALERRLGVQLAERNRAPVILTHAGKEILDVAKRIVAGVRDIQDIAKARCDGMSGILRLGMPTSISGHLLPAFLPKLHQDYPNLRFHIREDFPNLLPDRLAEGRFDFLIVPLPLRRQDFVTKRIFREPLYLAVPGHHRLAARDVVEPEELRDEPVLALEKGHALHEQVQMICEECGARVLNDYEGTSLNTLHQMTATGLGLTFLPGLFARSIGNSNSSVKLLTLKNKPLSRTIGLVWRETSPHAQDFLRIGNYLRSALKDSFPEFHIYSE